MHDLIAAGIQLERESCEHKVFAAIPLTPETPCPTSFGIWQACHFLRRVAQT